MGWEEGSRQQEMHKKTCGTFGNIWNVVNCILVSFEDLEYPEKFEENTSWEFKSFYIV